jgi:hypothetical protein
MKKYEEGVLLKIFTIILGVLVLSSCNPYEQYHFTHYNIKAAIDPEEAMISANVQMIFLPRQEYVDSICFLLNPGLKTHSLTAQELKYYEFNSMDTGKLVLYIQEPIRPNEQLHIAMSYSGKLAKQTLTNMDSSIFWYPVNRDTPPSTFQAKFALPGNWHISNVATGRGKHGKHLYQSKLPQPALNLIFTSE